MTDKEMKEILRNKMPQSQIAFILVLSLMLRDLLRKKYLNQGEAVLQTFDLALDNGFSWVSGGELSVNDLVYYVYNDEGTDLSELEGEVNNDFDQLGSIITTIIIYAGRLQYNIDGVVSIPEPFEMAEEEHVLELLFKDKNKFSEEIREYFDIYFKILSRLSSDLTEPV